MRATLRLFKAVPIKTRRGKTNKALFKETIRRGYVFTPEVIYNYPSYGALIDEVEAVYGASAEMLNASFHKSWRKIRDTEIEDLMVEQIAHYLTTYGKEQPVEYVIDKEEDFGVEDLGAKIIGLRDFQSDRVGDADYVYIPQETLNIPDVKIDDLKLVVIKGYTTQELKTKLLALLSSGIALGEDTLRDCLELAVFLEFDENDVKAIKNKEIKAALCDHLNIVFENPVEFLRYALYKATKKTLLIKSKVVTEAIRENKITDVVKLFNTYAKTFGLRRLAEIFYRFKPIFLAFRADDRMKPVINKIRRLAVAHHKPLPKDYLNTVTAELKRRGKVDPFILINSLNHANTFRKIRLAYALKFRTKDTGSILYRIRNGKGYATDFSFENKNAAQSTLNMVLNSIVEDVSKNVKGKIIYIPDYIHYSLPATEKQFTGNFPSGTYVTVPKDLIFGINWHNVDHHVIDLDLSLLSPTEGKIGWDTNYRDESKSLLFSGDITNASGRNGATELFYVRRQKKEAMILYVNYYNFDAEVEVPFKIIVAQEQVSNFDQDYMVDPNKLVSVINSKINQKEKILGLIVTTVEGNRFYFTEAYIGNSITSSNSEMAEHSRKYLFDFYEKTIGLKDILEKAGATIVDENDERVHIDLSPEALEKDTILNLLKKQ